MELESLMSAFAETLGIEGVEVKDGTCSLTIDYIPMEFTDLDKFVSKAEEWRETVENFRPAAEEAATRDEEATQFSKFGGNGPGFMSV